MDARRAAKRAAGGIARAVAAAFALLAGLAGIAHVAVSSGGLPLGPLASVIEAQLSARSGTEVRLGGGRLERSGGGGGGPLTLVLTDIEALRLGEAGGGGAVALPDLRLGLDTGDVMRGDVVPRRVATRGAVVRVRRTGEGLEVQGGEGALDLARLAQAAGAQGFEGISIEDASFEYRSDVSGAAFAAAGARIDVSPAMGGYFARARLPIGDGMIEADAFVGHDTEASLRLTRVPARVLTGLVPELPVRIEDARLSGTARLTGLSAGGRVAFALTASPGRLGIGERAVPFVVRDASGAFDLRTRQLAVTALDGAVGGSRGLLVGEADLSGPPAFSVSARDLVLDLPIYDAPRAFRAASVSGRYAEGRLALPEVAFSVADGPSLAGALSLALGEGAPSLSGSLAATGRARLRDILALWPDTLAPLTKGWVGANVDGGQIDGLTVRAAIPAGLIGSGERLGTDMLDVRFRLSDAVVRYLSAMPPSVGATADVHLTGTSFLLEARGGTVGGARVRTAAFEQPEFGPQRTPVRIAADIEGPLPALLAIADSPPLGYVTAARLSPDDFAGQGRFAFEMRRPLGIPVGPDRIEFGATGSFEGLGLTGLPAGIELSSGRGTLTVDGGALTIAADAEALGVPARGTLVRRFARNGAAPSMRLDAAATLTPRDADALGLPVRRYARGTAPAALTLEGRDRFETARVSLDLTATDLRVPSIGLDKRTGSHGRATARFVLPEAGGRLAADSLKLATPDVLIEGSAGWDEAGGLARLDLPRIFSDGVADLSAVLTRRAAGPHLALTGRHVDANGLVERLLKGGDEEGRATAPLALSFEAALDRVTARGGAQLGAVTAAGRYDGEALAELSLAASFAEGGRVSFEVAPDAGGVGREVRLATDRTGALLEALFGIDSVTGGDARLEATAIAGGAVTGRFSAEALTLRDAPLIARLLSVGSLDGLASVMAGEGLAFDKVSGALTLEDGTLALSDARMTGSALGLSANGEVDLAARRFDLSGAVAPAYGVNSFLGAIPGLGELFVSREGEGVVAFAYGVKGPIAEPTVSVNTLSALAPGVFRRLFEPVRPEKRTPEELLEAATEAAALREDRDTARSAESLAEEEEALGDGGAGPGGP